MKPLRAVSRRQLALGLESQSTHQPAEHTHEELLQALADLLLEALGEEQGGSASVPGEDDESEDQR